MGERTTLLLSEILKATGIKEAARDVKVSFEGPAQSRKLKWECLKDKDPDKDGDVEFTVLESFDELKLRLESEAAAYILVLKKAVVKATSADEGMPADDTAVPADDAQDGMEVTASES